MAKSPILTVGPFGSVVDPSDPGAAKPTRLLDAINMRIADPVLGSPAVQRHGFVALPQQLGATDVRRGQGMLAHRRLDGTLDRFTFGGGRMHAWDGATTFTDITPAGIAIDPVNPVFAASFDDRVIISDESNKPWVYDPKVGTGTVIEYNSIHEEWNTKGGPVIYSGRVVFIVQRVGTASLITEDSGFTLTTDPVDATLITEVLQGFQNTIAWSEALDPLSGYSQDNFDDTWTLTQSSPELLTCLVADEVALTYFRLGGISYITGKIAEDFRTSATVDAISGVTIGTNTPAATIAVDPGTGRKTWFLDLDGRVHRMTATGRPEELWRPMRRTVESQVGTAACRDNVLRFGRAAYHPSYKLVLFTIWDDVTLYAFDAESGAYMGTWGVSFGIHITAMGSLVDAAQRAVFLVIGTADNTPLDAVAGYGPDHGTVWRQKFPDDVAPWRDSLPATVSDQPVPFRREIETHWLAHSGSLVFRALSAVASVLGNAYAHTIGLAYTVPASGKRTAPLVASSSRVQSALPGEAGIAAVNWGLGRNAQGGAIRLRISAEEWSNDFVGGLPAASRDVQFGVHQIEVDIQTVKARRNAI